MTVHHVYAADTLITTVEGHLDAAATRRLLRSVASAATSDGNHVLVDLRDAEDQQGLSYPEVYGIVRELASYPEASGYRIALVDRYRVGFEKAQFFEAAGSEAGIRVKAFLDEGEARAWLREGT